MEKIKLVFHKGDVADGLTIHRADGTVMEIQILRDMSGIPKCMARFAIESVFGYQGALTLTPRGEDPFSI